MSAGWGVLQSEDHRSAAAWPLNDAIEHDVDGRDACVCGPRTELVEIAAGGTGWVHIHNAADGRELNEPDYSQLH